MPLFVCEKCGCLENTALGFYWSRRSVGFLIGSLPDDLIGKPLCSECTPEYFSDGRKTGAGKWHGRFEKEHWSVFYSEKPTGLLR